MQTGPSEIPALDRKTVNLYSDLLLHDMGPDLAGVCSGIAKPSEYRTAMLMGLRFRAAFLPDHRAGSLQQAVMFHGGEAARSRDVFERLTAAAEGYLIKFLSSL